MIKEKWKELGYVNEPIPEGIDIKAEIRRMCKEKNAVIMAHYYTEGEVQDLADFVGDSLALAQKAATTDADIIVMCGVHFMGETNKILCPNKTVLVPDLNASCSLAESCPAEEFKNFVKAHPGHIVVSYVNTTAATKAVTDVVVTSSNARQIVESFPKDTPMIFGPDENLGGYINSLTGRNMVLWHGACHVHERFSVEKILELKADYPKAKILAHPECKGAVLKLADKVGSTAALLKFALSDEAEEFIVYWLPRMQNNAYNLISFQTEAYTSLAQLEIAPAPDSLLRVFMAYRPLNAPVEVPPQRFEAFVRTGFTAVEWGGAEVR